MSSLNWTLYLGLYSWINEYSAKSASASFLGTGQVKEGFADLMDKVSKSGESRTEKINRTAAGLAINDYIAGKRSKENLYIWSVSNGTFVFPGPIIY